MIIYIRIFHRPLDMYRKKQKSQLLYFHLKNWITNKALVYPVGTIKKILPLLFNNKLLYYSRVAMSQFISSVLQKYAISRVLEIILLFKSAHISSKIKRLQIPNRSYRMTKLLQNL